MPQIVPAPPSLRSAGRCGSWPTKIDSWGSAATSARELSKLARAVLDSGDDARIRGGEPRHHRHRQADAADLRNMVEVQAQAIVADAIDQPGVRRVHAFVGHVLEEERRQHQRTGASRRNRVARQLDRVGQRGAAGGGQDALRRDAGREQRIECRPGARRRRTIGPRRSCRTARCRRRRRANRRCAWVASRAASSAPRVSSGLKRRAPEALQRRSRVIRSDVSCALRFGRDAGTMSVASWRRKAVTLTGF